MSQPNQGLENLHKLRHSAEHVLTQAMIRLYGPDKFYMAMGPATDDGFYFDFEPLNDFKISEEEFPKIEAEMQKIISENLPITKSEISLDEAKKLFSSNPYKLEWLNSITNRNEIITTYKTGNEFFDLCAGPHVESTNKIPAVKLLSTAGAYWHGDEKNKMLTRIYGTAFESQPELNNYLSMIEEAKKRDHRELNKSLKLYMISDLMGPGLITLLPNGAIIAEELEKWAKKLEEDQGYVRVFTPHIASEKLFKITGHVPHYLESMYPAMKMEDKGTDESGLYYVKPMNCAGHNLVYKSEPRSYRDLPLRVAEYGAVYRYEKSGELLGMMRVRGPIHQNDAHIFCTEEQAELEFQKVMDLHKTYYDALGLSNNDYYLSFAVRDKNNKEKYIGDDKVWDKAEKITLDYIKKTGIRYEIEEDGAAFYGPKIDFNIKTVTGKTFSASTNQLDFFIPSAFGCTYTDKDGTEKIPVCIHRAPLGAHVRFIAFLTEHFAGAFPVWLSPVQAKLIPITDAQHEFANKVLTQLKEQGIRAEIDDRSEKMQAKIRDAQLEKVPYMLVIGGREVEANAVAVRQRDNQDLGAMPVNDFIAKVKDQITTKSLNLIK